MLQLQTIRENKEEVIRRLAKKYFDGAIVHTVFELDTDRRKTQAELDAIKAEANTLARQIGELMKSGKKAEAEDI